MALSYTFNYFSRNEYSSIDDFFVLNAGVFEVCAIEIY